MDEVFYKHKFSEKTDIPEEPDLSLYDTDAQEFINLSIACANKSKSDIEISKNDHNIISVICIPIGTFFGDFKSAFLKFATKSEDFLIMPLSEKSKFALRVTATYNILPEDSGL